MKLRNGGKRRRQSEDSWRSNKAWRFLLKPNRRECSDGTQSSAPAIRGAGRTSPALMLPRNGGRFDPARIACALYDIVLAQRTDRNKSRHVIRQRRLHVASSFGAIIAG